MGEDAALFLNGLGYHVFAGVRKESDGDRVHALAAHPDAFVPLLLDITDTDQIASAVATVRRKLPSDRGVRALFSNAGVASFDGDVSCEGQPAEKLERVVDVDFLGAVATYGVRVAIVRPGAVATSLASHQHPELVPANSLYPNQAVVAHRFMEGMAKHEHDPKCSPRRVSELVARIIVTERPRAHYVVGGGKRVLSIVGSLPEPLQARAVNRRLTHA